MTHHIPSLESGFATAIFLFKNKIPLFDSLKFLEFMNNFAYDRKIKR